MDGNQLADYERRLRATGLSFAKGVSHDGGANLGELEDIPWGAVILRVMSMTGWRITDDAPRLPKRRIRDIMGCFGDDSCRCSLCQDRRRPRLRLVPKEKPPSGT